MLLIVNKCVEGTIKIKSNHFILSLFFLKKNTWYDVLKKDFDVFVAVAAVLFMMEPESVKELVLNNIVIDTSRTLERNNLFSTLAPQR